MSLEAWAALAQVGTFIVIAATAIAALVQLRHLRAANQVAATQNFVQMYNGLEFRDAFAFVRTELERRLEDPAYREELRADFRLRGDHPEIRVCNFFDIWGGYYRSGVIDRRFFMRLTCWVVIEFWERLVPVIALTASSSGVNTAFEHFEYLTVEARKWAATHPSGDYPQGVPRITLVDPSQVLDNRAQ